MVECIIVIDSAKDPWEWSKEELEYIPKPVLLKYMDHQIPLLWEKLPEHLRADSEVASCQTCHEHWNLPNCGDHIDSRASDARRRDKSRWREFFSPSLTPKGTQRDFSASVGPARWGEAMTWTQPSGPCVIRASRRGSRLTARPKVCDKFN